MLTKHANSPRVVDDLNKWRLQKVPVRLCIFHHYFTCPAMMGWLFLYIMGWFKPQRASPFRKRVKPPPPHIFRESARAEAIRNDPSLCAAF
jgi:hypothetical protein